MQQRPPGNRRVRPTAVSRREFLFSFSRDPGAALAFYYVFVSRRLDDFRSRERAARDRNAARARRNEAAG